MAAEALSAAPSFVRIKKALQEAAEPTISSENKPWTNKRGNDRRAARMFL
jgi:hypothetical protein